MDFKDVVIPKNLLADDEVGTAILKNLKRNRNSFPRFECPVSMDSANSSLVGAIGELKIPAIFELVPDLQTMVYSISVE